MITTFELTDWDQLLRRLSQISWRKHHCRSHSSKRRCEVMRFIIWFRNQCMKGLVIVSLKLQYFITRVDSVSHLMSALKAFRWRLVEVGGIMSSHYTEFQKSWRMGYICRSSLICHFSNTRTKQNSQTKRFHDLIHLQASFSNNVRWGPSLTIHVHPNTQLEMV